MYGLTFDGLHSFDDFGLIMFSKNRPILPEPKLITENLATIDGEWDFSEFNPSGRTLYKPRIHEIEFSLKERNPTQLRQKARQIAKWLSAGEKQLIYDDDPDVYHLARVQNKLDLENAILSVKRFTVQFKCRPFSFATTEITQTVELSASGYMIIFNDGQPVKPVITIEGTLADLTLSCGSRTLTYEDALSSEKLTIDCERGKAILGDSTNVNPDLQGHFLELENGNNVLEISSSGIDAEITCKYRPRFL